MSEDQFIWWKHGVIYQIYPRSFQDTNRDGIGDLAGIINRLDYLVDLGIDAVWISPIYPSPMADFGYDVSDYTDIDPLFGDLETFEELLDEAHDRGIKVILDYVPNHSSDEHPWFIESRSSRDNPKRDWYIWRDAKPDGSPPNNWVNFFAGNAWEWDEHTGQYYLHLFHKKQPDLNWRNPEVVAAMQDVLRFWLDLGVDGFRMDVVTFLIKHPDFPDNPPAEKGSMFGTELGEVTRFEHKYDINQPQVHEIIKDFRRIFESYPDERVTIGETWFLDPADLAAYYGDNMDELHIPFNFSVMKTPWDAAAMRATIEPYYAALPPEGWPNFVLGSHDESRLATRYGYENHRSAAMLLLTLRGTPTLYYGDEIGMMDVAIPPEKEVDPQGVDNPGLGIGRDPERTPMQWNSLPNAGFTAPWIEPWLPIAPNFDAVNVADQQVDPQSTLNFYKRLLRLRAEYPALHMGDLAFVDDLPQHVLAYTRIGGDERFLIVLNFGAEALNCDFSALGNYAELLLSTQNAPDVQEPFAEVALNAITLQAYESLLLRLRV